MREKVVDAISYYKDKRRKREGPIWNFRKNHIFICVTKNGYKTSF